MSMSGGSSGSPYGTTTTEPWPQQAQYLTKLFETGYAGTTGRNLNGAWLEPTANDIRAFLGQNNKGEDVAGKLQYYGDPDKLWSGNYASAGDNQGLGTGKLSTTAAPTVVGFTPEELAAQRIVKSRLQGEKTSTTADGITYNTGYDTLIPSANTAFENIIKGTSKIAPASFDAASIDAPKSIYRPSINTPGSMETPTIDSTDIEYKYWNALNSMASGNKNNTHLEDQIDNAKENMRNEYLNYQIPSLDTTAEGAGRYGSNTWANLRSDAYDKYLKNAGQVETTMRGEAYNNDMNRALQAMNLGGDLAKTQSGMEANAASQQAALEAARRTKEYDTSANINQLIGQLGLQADMAQAGNELQRNTQNAMFTQQANAGNAGNTQQANIQNLSNILMAAPQAPALSQSDYIDTANLAAVGESQGAKQQDIIDAYIKRDETNQMEPYQRTALQSNLISGDFGGSTTSRGSAVSGGGCI